MVKEMMIGTAIGGVVLLWIWGVDVMPLVLLGGLGAFVWFGLDMRSTSGRGQAAGRRHTKQSGLITFDDIGGQETAKQELIEALDLMNDRDELSRLGVRPLKGILLTGPPGTGKTLMAKATAAYTDSVFFSASGSEFVQMYAGVGARRVRQLFSDAKKAAARQNKKTAVIFIDEIEVLGGKRGRGASHVEYDQTVNELLVQIDGIDTNEDDVKVLVLAATNRPDLLDDALMRPGRFDRTVVVPMPDKNGRLHILKIHTKSRPLADDVDLEAIAQETAGFSGAHLESVVNEAAIYARREDGHEITRAHFKDAIEKVMMGERSDRPLRKEERERIAYHEAGHALITELVRPGAVASVTITPRGQALGYMRQKPHGDVYMHTKEELLDTIAIALGGPCAEEVFFGSRSTGAAGDIRQVMEAAETIVKGGMSSLGMIEPDMISTDKLHGEMQAIVEEQEQFVLEQIERCREPLADVARVLLEDEKISGERLRRLLGTRVSPATKDAV